jgi:hypothetical protein
MKLIIRREVEALMLSSIAGPNPVGDDSGVLMPIARQNSTYLKGSPLPRKLN